MGEKQERTPAEGWLDKATAGIRFGPDRKEVRRELEEHLEDKALDLQRIFPDLTAEEAKERAASEMGDPEEVGRELAKVHRPWLGYLWRVSQVVLGLACLSLLWSGMVFYSAFSVDDGQVFLELWDVDGLPMTNEAIEAYNMFGNGLTPRETYLPSGHPDQLQVWEDGPAVQIAGSTVRLRRAALWQEWQSRGGLALYCYFRVESPKFWVLGDLRWDQFTVTDSLGNQYPYNPTETEDRDARFFDGTGWTGGGPFHDGIQLRVQNVDPAAEWVRLDYWFGAERLFSMTLELDEGGGTE